MINRPIGLVYFIGNPYFGAMGKRELKEVMILNAAEKVFEEVGFANAKMDDIAKAASMSKGSIYFYFQSKENLYMAVTYRGMQKLNDMMYASMTMYKDDTGAKSVIGLLETYIDFAEDYPLYIEALLDYMAINRSSSSGQDAAKMTDAMLQSIYYQKIQDIYNNVVEFELNDIQPLVADVLLHELHELEYDFQCFISYRLSITRDYDENINSLLRRMTNPEKDMFNAVTIPYHLLSFNYSSRWSRAFRSRFSPVKFLDVHGKIPNNEGLKFSNIIFGVDHSLFQASELEYRTLKSYTQGFEKIGEGRDIYTKDIQTIKFYGHSLAEADYAYFQQLFDYYELYANPNLSLVFFYSVYDEKRSQEIEHEQIMAISRLIEKYGQTLDNKDHGKNLLTRLIQTKRLQMIKI
jgi:AcrR family transcriptional regulator